jgi:hypothetical protein
MPGQNYYELVCNASNAVNNLKLKYQDTCWFAYCSIRYLPNEEFSIDVYTKKTTDAINRLFENGFQGYPVRLIPHDCTPIRYFMPNYNYDYSTPSLYTQEYITETMQRRLNLYRDRLYTLPVSQPTFLAHSFA